MNLSMDLTLGKKQELFARLLPLLFIYAQQILSFEIRPKELLRDKKIAKWNSDHCRHCEGPRIDSKHPADHEFVAIGIENSLHCDGLAIDIILSKDSEIQWNSDSYIELGSFWKSLHPLCCWGGDFEDKDGGHFSITHDGRK